eukprot:CAMPEP_0172306976 /NCGR_PEP_ID=MMETSP1058-20130122/7927_1 /TAXON_ID=83371 /ORGANISM="Detonula confervacea, Strain CCMP 353" /LENGTH=721 /DNA_ID=CAMNT_0013019031 /DNA_START=532 /DNA_END=2697 /DNA_ORIENTATION=-
MFAESPGVLWFYITHPKDFRKKLAQLKEAAVKEAHHYWMGSKLLAADVRTARHIMGRTLRGSSLSRRERKQLLRTVTDVFRLVPMSIFVLIPFMEFALPFALKIFPSMLPSTFQDSLKEEEKMKGELQMRISMAGFFQDTLAELAKEQKKFAQIRKRDADDASDAESIEIEKEATAISFLEFLKKARTGEAIPPDVIIKFAKYFEDNLTMDNMGRMQLINMCKYMGIPPYGNDNLLRFQLRHRIRLLKDDDQRILWEGIDSLTKMELREACRERGMRSTGLSKDAYKKALQQWLDLSVQKNVPISLLIMSRTFFLHDEMVSGESKVDDGSNGVSGLADAMSGIDKEVLNEIVLEMSSSEEKSKNADVMKIQLEVLEHQNEMIKEEQEERDAAAKEKEEKEKTDVKEFLRESEILSTMEKTAAITNAGILAPTDAPGHQGNILNKEPEEEEQTELSTAEIDAISQLASPDPVHREREELKRIKDKMQGESETDVDPYRVDEYPIDFGDEQWHHQAADSSLEMCSAIRPLECYSRDEAQEGANTFKELEEAIEKEAKEVTVISMQGDTEAKVVVESYEDELVGDKKLQKAINRLKSRVESMVGKIETQLSDVEVKIGNKFHLLDKDGDGVLTMEEMAQVLQTVLKRELTAEEAMAIATDMDQNKDGVFSIAELAQWAETNTIVKLAEDGREKDLDEMITERVADLKERKKLKEETKIGMHQNH